MCFLTNWRRFIPIWAILIVIILYCFWYVVSAEQSKADDSKARKIKVSFREGGLYIGDTPFILSVYDSYGSYSTGFVSADYRNVIIDISEIPENKDPWKPGIGFQFDRDKAIAGVFLRRKLCSTVFIDDNGIVFPNKIRTIEEKGPYIVLTFNSPDKNPILLQDLTFEITSENKKKYEMRKMNDEMLILEKVPYERLRLKITSTINNTEWVGTIFPAFRSAIPGVVLYNVKNVTVGKIKSG